MGVGGSIRKSIPIGSKGLQPQSWAKHSQPAILRPGQSDTFRLSEPHRYPQLGGRIQVSGHLLSDPRHSQYPSSRHPIRCYAPGPGGEVRSLSVEEMVATPGRPFQPELPFEAHTGCGRELKVGEKVGRIAPKDHSLQIESISMRSVQGGVGREFFQQLSQIGRIENFQMRGLVEPYNLEATGQALRDRGCGNFQLHPSNAKGEWLEDYSEPLLNGGRVVPGHFQGGSLNISGVLAGARTARLAVHGLDGQFSEQGSVQQGRFQTSGGALAMLHGEKLYQAQSYVEGGNLLSGQRADGSPYLLVGQDSLDLTQSLLTKRLGRTPSQEEVRQVVADDYGVAADQVFGVEQPGEFHLDMRMTALAPGVIGLQDSPWAARLQAGWIREEADASLPEDWQQKVEQLKVDADRAACYEALTRRDLEKAGLKVVPMPGAFRNMERFKVDGANFFNGRHGTNPQGERYTIMMGGTAKQEHLLADLLLGQGNLAVDRLYFLDPEANGATLRDAGGLKCRTKPHGRLAPGF